MPDLFDPQLKKTFQQDKKYLETTQLPIVTVSATYQEDLKGFYGLAEADATHDIVFSRAHYSMALGVAVAHWQQTVGHIDPRQAWIVDPTNYVSKKDWLSVQLTETIGQTIARLPWLKTLKSIIDKFGRQKLPILDSISPPLLYLTQNITRPILSFHIATGNILAQQGKTVLQMITDPHVRDDYLAQAQKPNIYYLVFDHATKDEFLEKAQIFEKKVATDRVIVTGPPIDPRIIACRQQKQPWRSGPLKVCLATGGLGTNKPEIKTILKQLLPVLNLEQAKLQLLIYAGTHGDIYQMVLNLAKKHDVAVNKISTKDPAKFYLGGGLENYTQELKNHKLNVIYHPQIVDANELLIKHAFAWADGFITKPSGDMAYDAAAAGCFLLTLKEWGPWEKNIRQIFENKQIAQPAATKKIKQQLNQLTNAQNKAQSWVEQAMNQALNLEKLYLNGAKNILSAYCQVNQKLGQKTA